MTAADDVGNFAGTENAGNWSIAASDSAALALPMRTLTLRRWRRKRLFGTGAIGK